MDTKKALTLNDVAWLRAQRASIATQEELDTFHSQLDQLRHEITEDPGNGVRAALGYALLGLVIMIIAVVVGLWLMDIASAWMGDMNSGSGNA